MNVWTLFYQGGFWLVRDPKEEWKFCSFHISQISFFTELYQRTFYIFTNFIWSERFIWETKLNIWNHRSNLIKYGMNLFKIRPLVALTYEYNDVDLEFFTWSMMDTEFINLTFICNMIFCIDSNNPHIFISLCWKLMTG